MLVSLNLTDKILNIEHKFTIASDHASITLEIAADIERQGQGIFQALPYIQNNPIYVKQANEALIDNKLK